MAGLPPINALSANSALSPSPSTPVSQTDPRILAARLMASRLIQYRTFGAYYHGQHRLAFASEKFRNTFGRLFYQFADNLCPAICDAVADRMVIIDFATESGPAGLGKTAWKYWQDQKMKRRSGELHLEALRNGDGYVIVWPDPETKIPRIYPQLTEQMTVFYDDEVPGKILWAAKSWQNPDQMVRLNMYYPDRIEKWITVKKMSSMPTKPQFWTKFIVPGETWPLVNEWGRVPVFHFVNNAPPGKFGKSELKDALPLQDALNKSVIDMLVAMEYVALPQRYATGVETEIDEATNLPILPFQPSVDRLWLIGDDQAKFGEFAAANLNQLLDVQNDLRLEMARVTRTPLHYMMPPEQAPSGDALKVLEEPLVKKVLDRSDSFGDTWAEAVQMALRMQGLAGEDDRLSTTWDNPAPKSGLEDAQTQQIKKTIGVSRRQLLYEMGYNETKINEMEADNQKDQAQEVMPGAPGQPPSQIQPAGNTHPGVSPHADGQRLDTRGNPTLAQPVKNQ